MEQKIAGRDCPMERELSEKEIVELFKQIPGGIAMYEFRDGNIYTRYYSDGMERLTGFSWEEREQISGRLGYRRIHEEDRAEAIRTIEESVQRGESFDVVYRFRRKDETYTWIRVMVNMVAMGEGIFSFYVIFTDLNEMREQAELLKKQEERLRTQQRRNEICQKEFGIDIWEYDIEKREHIIEKSCGFWYEMLQENQSLDIMSENSRKKYQLMLEELHSGVESTSADIEIMTEGISSWYHVQYLTIFSEENHQPVRAIGMSRRLEEYREYELKYQKEVLKSNRVDANGLASHRVNLTKDKVEESVFLKPCPKGFGDIESAHEFLEDLKNKVEDSTQLKELDKLIYQVEHNYFQGEQKNYYFEYYKYMPDQLPIWIRIDMNILKRPVSEEMIAFVYVSDVSREKYEKLVMDKVLGTDYDYLAMINVESGKRAILQRGEQGRNDNFRENIGDYKEDLEKRVSKIIDEEKEAAAEEMELSRVKEELEKNSSYSCSYYYQESELQVRRKKWMFSYLDERKNIMLLRRSDITGMYQQHEEQNEKLKEALAKAEEASAAKSRFLSNMSHDMRTPMNAIIGFSDDLMTKGEDAEGLRKMLHQVNTSGKYLLSLINNVLDMSWIESKKLVLHLEPVRFAQIFEEIRLLIMPQMEKKQIHFVMEERGDAKEYLMCDKVYIKQVLMNLLSNAMKFTPVSGEIQCISENIHRGDGYVEKQLSVRDSGIGMSEEFLPKVFESFEQENDADKSTYTGTGLGMAIVKGIIDLMGGTIDVKSKKGEGTEFTIRVRLSCCDAMGKDGKASEKNTVQSDSAPAADAKENTGQKKEPEEAFPDFTGKRVLLCEDHPINKMVAEKMLAMVNCQMEHAENGKIGTELFAASAPGYYDLILMDVQMPEMNGMEAAKAIRAMERPDAKTVPIIAMTANAFTEDIERSKAAGMNRHIGKPVQPMELYKVMAESFDSVK